MNFIDLIIIVPILIGAWRGFKKGLIIELFTLLALLVGLYAGIHFSDYISQWIQSTFDFKSQYLPVISFTVTFLGVGAMVYFAGKMIEKAIKVVALGLVNKIAGAVFGLTKFLFAVSAFLVIIESYDEKNDFFPEEKKEESLLYTPVKQVSLTCIPPLRHSDLFLKAIE